MKLFVGLGNPGAKYARNRHNVGFMAVERIADRHGCGPWRRRFQGETAEGTIAGERVLILKPGTYMNESGRAVGEAVRFLKIAEPDIVVFYDEIDLAPGKLKVKTGGGNAGHNGLRSLSAHIGNDYVRVRIGVGHPGHKDLVVPYVLHDFAKADQEWLEPLLDAIAGACGHLAAGDQARFLTEVAKALPKGEPRAGLAKSDPPAERSAPASNHPAGDRMSKRQTALAENLKKWLSGRRSKE
jgi:peptidyl-tRNA hydrolase, PTH1 family